MGVAIVFLLLLAYLAYNVLNEDYFSPPHITTSKSVEEISEELELYLNQTEGNEREHPLGGEIDAIYDKTPYVGNYFNLVYNESDAWFYLYIDPSSRTEGNKEFDQFLKDNGIPNRSFFKGLKESNIPLPTGL